MDLKKYSIVLLAIMLIGSLCSCDTIQGPSEEQVISDVKVIYNRDSIRTLPGTYKVSDYATVETVQIDDRMIEGKNATIIALITLKYKTRYEEGSFAQRTLSGYLNKFAEKNDKKSVLKEFYYKKFDSGWRLNDY